jgi:hypothetical protein
LRPCESWTSPTAKLADGTIAARAATATGVDDAPAKTSHALPLR